MLKWLKERIRGGNTGTHGPKRRKNTKGAQGREGASSAPLELDDAVEANPTVTITPVGAKLQDVPTILGLMNVTPTSAEHAGKLIALFPGAADCCCMGFVSAGEPGKAKVGVKAVVRRLTLLYQIADAAWRLAGTGVTVSLPRTNPSTAQLEHWAKGLAGGQSLPKPQEAGRAQGVVNDLVSVAP